MPVSRGKRRKRSKMVQPKAHLTPQSPRVKPRLWPTVRDTVGLFAALIAIGGLIYDALRQPEISPHEVMVDQPFSLRFSLKNPSIFFSMTRVKVRCGIDVVNLSGGGGFRHFSIQTPETIDIILPGKNIEYNCPIDRAFKYPGQTITGASIYILAKYKTLIINRKFESEQLTWEDTSKVWTQGRVIN
jgi:hypothetical protein